MSTTREEAIWRAVYAVAYVDADRHDSTENGLGSTRLAQHAMEMAGKAVAALQTIDISIPPEPKTFEQAWAVMKAQGYQYGPDALEQVRFGWDLAKGIKP